MILDFIKNSFARHWQLMIVIFLAIIFFFATSSFNYLIQKDDFVKWSSPDETANYFFTNLYTQTNTLTANEAYNLYASDIVHPRSFRSDIGSLKPVSFLGIILIYGAIASVTSYKVIPFLTPFFGAIGIIFYFLFTKKLFSQNIAFASSLLLSSFPVYTYYSARSMFHNVLFTVLLIIGLYFALRIAEKDRLETCFYAALSGLFIGLAIITRTSELIWIAPMVFFLWIFNIKRVGILKGLYWLAFMFLAFLPVLYWNQILYSSPLQSGYPEMNQTISNIASSGYNFAKSIIGNESIATDELRGIKENVFYFGFKSYESFMNFLNYFFIMFALIASPAILGGFLMIQDWRKLEAKHRIFLFVYFFISAILVLYYGSWKFHDNPDASQITIGNSYTRYWLPIYLGAIPLACLFIERFTKEIFNKKEINIGYKNIGLRNNSFIASLKSINNKEVKAWKFKIKNSFRSIGKILIRQKQISKNYTINALRILFIGIIIFTSVQFVLFGSSEGLIQSYWKQKNAQQEYETILSLTEENAVIVTLYHDKLFFPQRRVIVGLFDDKKMVANYAKIAQRNIPLYYYNFTLPQKSVDYLNNKRLKESGLQIEKIERVGEFTLYKLISIWGRNSCYYDASRNLCYETKSK